MAVEENLTITRGDYIKWKLTLKDENDAVYNITDWTIYFTLKTSLKLPDLGATLQKTITSHSDAVNGETIIELLNTETDDLNIGTYYYDIQVKTKASKIYTVKKGTFTVTYDVTSTS